MSTEAPTTIESILRDKVADLTSERDSFECEMINMQDRMSNNLDDACDALFVNDLSTHPGKLIIIDYWGNEIGEWTPETLREFMEGRLL